jgi:putative Ca2+/H+ antiporter (TMEM165/GDT1 family)
LTEADEERAARPARYTILTVGTVFFLAELGDKTMLATITLATREGAFGVWLGSTVGMVVADGLAILVGRLLGARLPERAIRIGAAMSFFVFAAVMLIEAI